MPGTETQLNYRYNMLHFLGLCLLAWLLWPIARAFNNWCNYWAYGELPKRPETREERRARRAMEKAQKDGKLRAEKEEAGRVKEAEARQRLARFNTPEFEFPKNSPPGMLPLSTLNPVHPRGAVWDGNQWVVEWLPPLKQSWFRYTGGPVDIAAAAVVLGLILIIVVEHLACRLNW